jgi:hypothetical protein
MAVLCEGLCALRGKKIKPQSRSKETTRYHKV